MIEDAFAGLLFRLEPGLSGSDAQYKQLRLKMVKFFSWRRCIDAENLADETITRVVDRINMGTQISNPYSYVYAVANHVYQEYVRDQIKKEKLADSLSEQLDEPQNPQDCKAHCLKNLPPDKLKLIQEYYLEDQDRESMAQERGITLSALRVLVHRIRIELKACYEKCNK